MFWYVRHCEKCKIFAQLSLMSHTFFFSFFLGKLYIYYLILFFSMAKAYMREKAWFLYWHKLFCISQALLVVLLQLYLEEISLLFRDMINLDRHCCLKSHNYISDFHWELFCQLHSLNFCFYSFVWITICYIIWRDNI